MTAASAPHLRPLGLGELLDQAIRLYRRNFLKFIGIIAVVQVPLALLQLLVSVATLSDTLARLQNPPDDPFGILRSSVGTGGLFGLFGFILIQGLATAATTRAVADSYLGEVTGFVEAYRKIGRSWLSLLGALLLAALVSIALGLWTIVPCVGWFTGLGMLIFFSSVVVPLIAPVIVLEKRPASQSIRRAWDLARRRFWWTLGFVFVLYLFAQLIIAGPAALLGVLFQIVAGGPAEVGNSPTLFTLQTVIQSLVSLALSLLYLPLQVTCITLLYFDLRVRTEGFDLALLAGGATGDPAADVAAQAPPLETARLVTGKELGYFVLIELAGVGLYCIFVFALTALIFATAAASGGF